MTTFKVVPGRSIALFEARSSLHPITAECKSVSGYLCVVFLPDGSIDTGSEVAGRIEIPIDGLVSGNSLYDRELRRRMDSTRYPTIIGDLKKLCPHEGAPRHYQMTGEITVRGETRASEEVVEISMVGAGMDLLHLVGSHTFDMRDFKIDPPRLALVKVHPELKVSVDLYLEEQENA